MFKNAFSSAIIFMTALLSLISLSNAQNQDKGKFIDYPNPFWDEIKNSADDYNKPESETKKVFKMELDGLDLPKSIDEFETFWHIKPISQGWTGTCWCFSTTSFLESEVKRIHNQDIDISELYTVYFEYIEKARRFVRERGKSIFAEGSQANAVFRMWDKYGCVPASAYTGLQEGQQHHDHHLMYKEMNEYLNSVKKRNAWNEEQVLNTIKSILNHYLGEPPSEVTWDGVKMTPMQFRDNVVKLKMDEYVDVLSLKQQGYWKNAVYPVRDNWWESERYKNVPLDDFMGAMKKAIKSGYSMFIGGDVSSVGYNSMKEVAVVPDFDIPSDYINEDARQLRFSNGSTTDDHGIHIVGYKEDGDDLWFLIKDSGSGSRNGNNKGYYFYHEDYIKLKMMNFVVHESAIKELLDKFNKNKSS